MKGLRYGLAVLAGLMAWGMAGGSVRAAASPVVVVATVQGTIDSTLEQLVQDAVATATAQHAEAVVLDINTLGGKPDTVTAIAHLISESAVPVVAYVGSGSAARNTGLLLVEAADLVVIGPDGSLGNTEGGGDSATAAAATQLARQHARDERWVQQVFSGGGTVNGVQAVAQHTADRSAGSIDALVQGLNGTVIVRASVAFHLHTVGAQLVAQQLTTTDSLLHASSNPDIVYLLIVLTLLAFGLWIVHPAVFVPGALALLSGALAVFSISNLPVNSAGLLLMALSLVLYVVDIKAATHGALTIAGSLALGAGGLLLIDTTYLASGVSPRIIGVTVLPLAAWFALIVRKVIDAKRRPYQVAGDGIVGRLGEMRQGGMVRLDGVLWTARNHPDGDPMLPDGTPVRIVAMNGLCLDVEPLSAVHHRHVQPRAAASPAAQR